MSLQNTRYASIFGNQYKEIGPFRFPVLKSLTAAERQLLQDLQRENAENGLTLFTLAERIRKEKGLSLSEAVDLIQQPNPEQSEMLQGYSAELLVILKNATSAATVKSRLVTVCLATRGEFLNEGGAWETTSDWHEGLTKSLPEGLIDQIHEFLMIEQNGGKPLKSQPQTQAPQVETRPSKPKSKRTGKSSPAPESTGETTTGESSSQE